MEVKFIMPRSNIIIIAGKVKTNFAFTVELSIKQSFALNELLRTIPYQHVWGISIESNYNDSILLSRQTRCCLPSFSVHCEEKLELAPSYLVLSNLNPVSELHKTWSYGFTYRHSLNLSLFLHFSLFLLQSGFTY